MPKLADLLPIGVKESSEMGAERLVKFAYLLGTDLRKAKALYEKYGNGCIYARSGFTMPDTPFMRRKMVANFGDCVIIDEHGEMWVRTKRNIGAINRKRGIIIAKVERRGIANAERKHREARRTNRLFKDGQTQPQPKRAGKGNGQGDIGKYVNFRGGRMDYMERRAEDKFVTISIKY